MAYREISAEQHKQDLEQHRLWRESGGDKGTRLNWSGCNLRHADLSHADLWHANLWHADLWHADLSHANLRHADLSHADLSQADLSQADLSHADLSHADLWHANLWHADLWHAADLSDAPIINFNSHQLISEILLRAAGDNVDRRMVVGLIHISPDWCWEEFLGLTHPQRQWALEELAKWVKDGDNAPEILKRMAAKNTEEAKAK